MSKFRFDRRISCPSRGKVGRTLHIKEKKNASHVVQNEDLHNKIVAIITTGNDLL